MHGRAGDLIITGGENVWPEPVEAVLAGLRGVGDVAVAGVDDPTWGQRVVAFVELDGSDVPPTLDGIRGAVREVLPAYCAPRQLVVVDELPRAALGKVQRRRVAAEAGLVGRGRRGQPAAALERRHHHRRRGRHHRGAEASADLGLLAALDGEHRVEPR